MINIPTNRSWQIKNTGDVFGNLYYTHNVNFDEQGYLKVSPKAVSIYSTGDDADFQRPTSIFPFNSEQFILTIGDCFSLGSDLDLDKIASSPATNLHSDSLSWQNRAYVTLNDNLSYYDGSSWTNSLKSLTASVPHPLEVMDNFASGHLVVGNGNTVLRLDTSHSTVVTLTLNANYQVTCLKYFQNNLYIGTRTLNGRTAKVFIWNGSGTSAQSAVSVGANWVFALQEYDSSIACVTSEGQIKRYTGGGFSEIANFPVYYTRYRWTKGAVRVQRRGFQVDGDLIYINIQGCVSNVNDNYFIPQQPSGIWCYDPKVGLYCRHLSTTDPLLTVVVSSVSSSILTLASAIRATTGEPIYLDEVGSLTGVTTNTTYYVIKVSDTTIKLATTPANAHNGVSVTIAGTAGSASVKVVSYAQYGEVYNTGNVGAIGLINDDGLSPPIFPELTRTDIIWGLDDSDDVSYLNCLTTASNVGRFVTVKVWSRQVQDTFQKLFLKYSNLNLASEKITIKSRIKDVFGLPTMSVSGTYSSDDTIGSASDYKSQVVTGNNLNIISGKGSGRSFNITVDQDEFQLDQDVPGAVSTDEVIVNFDVFEKRGVATVADDQVVAEISLGDDASWHQLMVELQGQEVRIEEIQDINSIYQESA